MAGTFDGAVCSPPASIKCPKYSTDGIKNSYFSLQTHNDPALCLFSLFVRLSRICSGNPDVSFTLGPERILHLWLCAKLPALNLSETPRGYET